MVEVSNTVFFNEPINFWWGSIFLFCQIFSIKILFVLIFSSIPASLSLQCLFSYKKVYLDRINKANSRWFPEVFFSKSAKICIPKICLIHLYAKINPREIFDSFFFLFWAVSVLKNIYLLFNSAFFRNVQKVLFFYND